MAHSIDALHRNYLKEGAERPLVALGYRKVGRRFEKVQDAGLKFLFSFSRRSAGSADCIWEFGDAYIFVENLETVLWPTDIDLEPPDFQPPILINIWAPFPEELPDDIREICRDNSEAELGAKSEFLQQALTSFTVPWIEKFSNIRMVADHLADPSPAIGRTRFGYREIPHERWDLINSAGCYILAGDGGSAIQMIDLAMETKASPDIRAAFWPRLTVIRDRIHLLAAGNAQMLFGRSPQ